MPACPFETFPALSALPVLHAFTGRVPHIDVKIDRTAALERLAEHHAEIREHIGAGGRQLVTAEQVHGAVVTAVRAGDVSHAPGADALITDDPSLCLGIYVADCGPVWLMDPVRRAIGCIHSGRKGTELGIA
ncbi:MAG: laccase domain-containing protein, partial [Chthoniobacteraceae bacterium]